MGVVSIILQVVLGLGFLFFGYMKFSAKQMVDEFTRYGYPQWFRIVTGLVEVLAGILVLVGIWNEQYAFYGGVVITITMVGAIVTHLKLKDPAKILGMPIILLILGIIVAWLNKGAM